VLDVEGAELRVLQSLDFSRLTVDVIVIEADGRDAAKDLAVVKLLVANGMKHEGKDP
jgi:hypothetical protein